MDGEQSDFPKRVSLGERCGKSGGVKQIQSLVCGRTWQFIRRWRDQYYNHAQSSQKNREFEDILHSLIVSTPRCAALYDGLHSDVAAKIAISYRVPHAVQ